MNQVDWVEKTLQEARELARQLTLKLKEYATQKQAVSKNLCAYCAGQFGVDVPGDPQVLWNGHPICKVCFEGYYNPFPRCGIPYSRPIQICHGCNSSLPPTAFKDFYTSSLEYKHCTVCRLLKG